MHARIITVQIRLDKVDEVVRIFRESVLPAARQQKGLQNLAFLTDPNTGKAMAVGLWETLADLQASDASGYLPEQFAKVAGLLAVPPTREVFELSAQF